MTFHVTGAGTVSRGGVTRTIEPNDIFLLRSNQEFEFNKGH